MLVAEEAIEPGAAQWCWLPTQLPGTPLAAGPSRQNALRKGGTGPSDTGNKFEKKERIGQENLGIRQLPYGERFINWKLQITNEKLWFL